MKPSKKTIEPLLDEYGRLQLRAIAIELQRDRDLQPHKESYEKKAGPIVGISRERLDSINARLKVLFADIEAQLKAGVDEKAGTVALREVTAEIETTKLVAAAIAKANKAEAEDPRTTEDGKPLVIAIAEVQVKDGNRQIDPQKFFEHVEKSKRDAKFWGCLKVGIAEAQKFLGAAIDKLATKPKDYKVSISLK